MSIPDTVHRAILDKVEECEKLKGDLKFETSRADTGEEFVKKFFTKAGELTKLKEEHAVTVKKHLVAASQATKLEGSLYEMTDKFIAKFNEAEESKYQVELLTEKVTEWSDKFLEAKDMVNKGWVQNEKLENEVEKLRMRQEELEDMLRKKSKELKKKVKSIEELKKENSTMQRTIDELEEEDSQLVYDEEQTYTEEDYDAWDARYKEEKKKRKAAEEMAANKDDVIEKLTAQLAKKPKIIIDLTD